MPWASGYRLCEVLNIGQDWLATGEGERDLFVSLSLSQQDANELGKFSSVFSGKYAGDLSAIRRGALASADTAIESLKYLGLLVKRINTDSKLREKVRGDPRWMALLKEAEETYLAAVKALGGEKKRRMKIETKLR